MVWTPLVTVEAATGKTLVTRKPSETCRFYRAVVQPDAGRSSN
jgi:hypothetical protein